MRASFVPSVASGNVNGPATDRSPNVTAIITKAFDGLSMKRFIRRRPALAGTTQTIEASRTSFSATTVSGAVGLNRPVNVTPAARATR